MPKRDINGSIEAKIAVIANDIKHIKNDIADIKKKLQRDFVTKAQREEMVSKVSSLESLKDWMFRIVIGAIVLATLALLGLRI